MTRDDLYAYCRKVKNKSIREVPSIYRQYMRFFAAISLIGITSCSTSNRVIYSCVGKAEVIQDDELLRVTCNKELVLIVVGKNLVDVTRYPQYKQTLITVDIR